MELIERLARGFARATPQTIQTGLDAAIGDVARTLGFDYGLLIEPPGDDGLPGPAYRWSRDGYPPLEASILETDLPWIAGRLASRAPVILSTAEDLPVEATGDRDTLRRLGLRSVTALSLDSFEAPGCHLVLAAGRDTPSPALTGDGLARIADVLGPALGRAQSSRLLRQAFAVEQTISDLATSLIGAPAEAIDEQIVRGLGTIARLFGADRGVVIRHDPAQRLLIRTHLWVRDGTGGPPPSSPEDAFPWLVEHVIRRQELITLVTVDDLPPEGARDRASLQASGVVSGALVPLAASDRLVGLLAIARVSGPQQWPSPLVARLRLVGQIIAGVLVRREAELSLRGALAENERLREQLAAENAYLQAEVIEARDLGEIVGQSPPLRAVLDKVRQVAGTTAPVLLLGETGTGKELVARAVHENSPRRVRPFIAVNCAALPATLVESELFGHEKGAFTGASQAKPGRFELADHGTLFLDELGELEPALQAKLLRALESGEVQRLGSTVTRRVDVRILAATNRDVEQDLRTGRLRADLYYRLSVFPIELPPLRSRREDVPVLVWHFIRARQRTLGRSITHVSRAAMTLLQAYDWPGNVRELQNVVERALILSRGPALQVEEALGRRAAGHGAADPAPHADSLRDAERTHIARVLADCRWTIEGRGQAAERLGLNPSTLRNRMRKLGIKRPGRELPRQSPAGG